MYMSTMESRVADYLDRSDLTTEITGWINDTVKDIATRYEFDYLFTEASASTTSGTQRYALPSDYMGHLILMLGTKKLVRLTSREYDEITGDQYDLETTDSATVYMYTTGSSRTDEPDYYVDRGMEIDLYPIPNATYTLTMRYYSQPDDLSTATSDENYISRFHPDAINFGAAWRGALFLDDADKIAHFKAAYDEAINQMIGKEKRKDGQDYHVRMRESKDYALTQFKRLMKVNT